jgi:hypothetical protein
MERFLAKAEILLLAGPRAKAPGQFMLGYSHDFLASIPRAKAPGQFKSVKAPGN